MNTKLACIFLLILVYADLSAQFNKANLLTTDELLLHGKIVGLSPDSIFFQQKKLGFSDAIDWKYVQELTVRKRRDYRWLSVPLVALIGSLPGVLFSTFEKENSHEGFSPFGMVGAVVGVAGGITGGYYGYQLFKPKVLKLAFSGDPDNRKAQKAFLQEFIHQ